MRQVHWVMAAAFLISPRANAIPTNPDPIHTAAATPWSNVPINMLDRTKDQHQHYNADNLFLTAGKFRTFSVWDDNQYRYDAITDVPLSKATHGQDYGHGYMQNAATYKFDISVPAAGRPLFNNNVVTYWEGAINGSRMNSNNHPIRTLINFGEVLEPLVSDILIKFAPTYPRGPAGAIMEENFPVPAEIEPDGSWGGNPHPDGGRDGALAVWTPSIRQITFNSNISWYFLIPGIDPGPGQYDFISTALHEFGHALGLKHEGAAGTVMFATQSAFKLDPTDPTMQRGIPFDNTTVVRTLDNGTRDGSIALYSVAVPEPGTLVLLVLGALVPFRWRVGHGQLKNWPKPAGENAFL